MSRTWQIVTVQPFAATFPLMERITGCTVDLPGPRKGRPLITFPDDAPAAWTPVTSISYRRPRTSKYVEQLQQMLSGILFVDPEIVADVTSRTARGDIILGGKYVNAKPFVFNDRLRFVSEDELCQIRLIEKEAWRKRTETDKNGLPKLKPGDKVVLKNSLMGFHGTVNRVSGDQIKVTLANGVLQSAVVSRLLLDLLPNSSQLSTQSAVAR